MAPLLKKPRSARNPNTQSYARKMMINAARERVFDAVATLEGLQGWWTTQVSGKPFKGGDLRFEYAGLEEHIDMHVEEFKRPTAIHWTCAEHTELDEWRGSRLTFELSEQAPKETELCFVHDGLTPQLGCYDVCRQGWDHFLASLVAYVEDGKGTPWT